MASSGISFSSAVSAPSRLSSLPPRRRVRVTSTRIQSKIREIFMPALSSTMTEGKIVSWIKSEGDVVSKGESVVVVESDKADMDVETFYDGILAAIVVPEGLSAPVGAPIGLLAETPEEVALAKATAAKSSNSNAPKSSPPPPTPTPAAVTSAPPAAAAALSSMVATPFAKKLAKQHKVDIASVVGTGPFGRVTPADVEAKAGIKPPSPAVKIEAPTPTPTPIKTQSSSQSPMIEGSSVVGFTTMQAAVSRNMMESLSVPTFRVGYPVSTDALDALYAKVKGKGVTMTALLAKAAGMALAQHPVVNAAFCNKSNGIRYNAEINVAVAVAIEGGLITPVLRGAHTTDLYLLSQQWKELVGKARSKQLQPNDYNSGTFTLSNLGMFGVDRFDAILPPAQGAIMAVGASKPTVVADSDGFFTVKNKMLVNVTADHRIIYGADLAAFLQTFAKIIENPDTLTL